MTMGEFVSAMAKLPPEYLESDALAVRYVLWPETIIVAGAPNKPMLYKDGSWVVLEPHFNLTPS